MTRNHKDIVSENISHLEYVENQTKIGASNQNHVVMSEESAFINVQSCDTRENSVVKEQSHVDINVQNDDLNAHVKNMSKTCPTIYKVNTHGTENSFRKNDTSNSDILKIICWNINGLHDKLADKENQNMLFQNDIIIISETHSKSGLSDKFDVIPGFKYFDFPRTYIHPHAPMPSGGIGVFIKQCLLECTAVYSANECIVWVQLKQNSFGWDRDKYLCCVYFSPSDSTYLHNTIVNTDYFNILQDQLASHTDKGDIFICGDTNARTGQLQDNEVDTVGRDGDLEEIMYNVGNTNPNFNIGTKHSLDHIVNIYGKNLLEFCKCTHYRIMNGRLHTDRYIGEFTYESTRGKSVIDLLLCQCQNIACIGNFKVLPLLPTQSDHKPIFFTLNLPVKMDQTIPKNEGVAIARYKWKSSQLDNYLENFENELCQDKLDDLLLHLTDDTLNGDQICKLFYDYVESAIRGTFSIVSSKKDGQFPINPWFDSDCKKQKHIVHSYKASHDVDIEPYKCIYHYFLKEYHRITQQKSRSYSQNIRNKLKAFESSNPSEYWKLWKSFKRRCSNSSTLTLTKFDTYFNNQVKPPNVDYFDLNHMLQIEDFITNYDKSYDSRLTLPELDWEICNGTISIEEIATHIEKLKLRKASGTDGISGEFIKHGKDKLINPLHGVLNFLFNKGDWPEVWAEGLINPIHKKASQNIEDNYRKVTVMPSFGKLFESILNGRLTFRNIVLDLDDNLQFGFKQYARTTDNMFILNSLIQRQRLKNKPLYVCFVDFTKAFDYINRSALYYKLIKRGVRGKLLNIIMSMFDKAKCKVKWKGLVGGDIDSEFGVLQGGMMSPKLFTEFLTDLHEYLSAEGGVQMSNLIISYILFADDMILCSETPEGLQKLLDGLFKYCSKWHLILSLTKTKIMIFNSRKTKNLTFTFNNKPIELVTEYKYVGTIFSSNTQSAFKNNCAHLIDNARKAMFGLKLQIKDSVGYLPPDISIKMFDKMIRPILDYACEIWYMGKQDYEIEKVHLGYLKYLLNVKPSSCTPALYAECGRFPLVIKQKIQALKYWKRLLESKDSSAIKNSYNSLYESQEFGQENWCTYIKNVLIEVEMAEIWNKQCITDPQIKYINAVLHDKFLMGTLSNIVNSEKFPKLRTYKKFKTDFRLENYLTEVENRGHQIALSKFRLSSHNLRIETGRYERKPKLVPHERLCIFCDKNSVECEIHFLTDCTLYMQDRNLLYKICQKYIYHFNYLNNDGKFTEIMKSKEKNVIRALGKFVYNSMLQRSNLDPNSHKKKKKRKVRQKAN